MTNWGGEVWEERFQRTAQNRMSHLHVSVPTTALGAADLRQRRLEWLALALVLTIASHAVPGWRFLARPWQSDFLGLHSIPWATYVRILFLMFGLALVLPTRRRSGLIVGDIRTHWRKVVLVCGGPVLLTLLVYPQLPVRPFANAGSHMWLISPFAQSLVFIGYIYGRLEPLFPSFIHPRVQVRWALVITAGFFAAWHLPGFTSLPVGYAVFQLGYTGIAYVIPALSRQWTGSIFYVALCHTAINFIAWATS